MRGGLGKDFVLRIPFRNIVDLGVQFRCQLHPCALMSIYGSFVGSLVVCFVLWLVFLVGWVGFYLEELELIMVAYDMLAGKSVVMGLLVGLGRPLMRVFCLTFLACWAILLGLVGLCWVVPLSFGTTPFPLLEGSLRGGFLWVERCLASLEVSGARGLFQVLEKAWVLLGEFLLEEKGPTHQENSLSRNLQGFFAANSGCR